MEATVRDAAVSGEVSVGAVAVRAEHRILPDIDLEASDQGVDAAVGQHLGVLGTGPLGRRRYGNLPFRHSGGKQPPEPPEVSPARARGCGIAIRIALVAHRFAAGLVRFTKDRRRPRRCLRAVLRWTPTVPARRASASAGSSSCRPRAARPTPGGSPVVPTSCRPTRPRASPAGDYPRSRFPSSPKSRARRSCSAVAATPFRSRPGAATKTRRNDRQRAAPRAAISDRTASRASSSPSRARSARICPLLNRCKPKQHRPNTALLIVCSRGMFLICSIHLRECRHPMRT